jgi:hypothetical protein
MERLVLAVGGVAAQAAGARPRDEREDEVERGEAGPHPEVRPVQLLLELGGNRRVGQVKLQHAGRLAAGVGHDRLQHADDPLGSAGRVGDDLDVLAAARGCAERDVRGGKRACGGAVVGEDDAAGEAANAQAHDGPGEDRQLGRLEQPPALAAPYALAEVVRRQHRRDRHLLDDRGLRAPLGERAVVRLLPVSVGQHGGERQHGNQAGDRVDQEQP